MYTQTHKQIINRSFLNMVSSSTTSPPVEQRFENLILSPVRVMKMIGKQRPNEITFEQSEQGYARRKLLHIEKQALKNKKLNAINNAAYIETVKSYVHEIVLSEITEHLTFTSEVFNQTLNLPDDICCLLDALSVRASSVSLLESHAATIPWLYDELIQVVNSAAFQRRDSKGKVIVVETLRTALGDLGIDNLRHIVPSLILKRAMPQVTDPYPDIKIKLTQYANGTAVVAKHLARVQGLSSNDAFSLGLLSNLGRCAIIRLYFKLFDKVHLHLLEECIRDKEQERYQALLNISPCANYLIALQNEFADAVAADLLENMMLKRLKISESMRLCINNRVGEKNTLSQLLNHARIYTQIRMLHQSKMVNISDVKPLIRQQNYPKGALEQLKNIDIFTLPVHKDERNR